MSLIARVFLDDSRELQLLWGAYLRNPSSVILPTSIGDNITLKMTSGPHKGRHFFKVPFSRVEEGRTHVLEVHDGRTLLKKVRNSTYL